MTDSKPWQSHKHQSQGQKICFLLLIGGDVTLYIVYIYYIYFCVVGFKCYALFNVCKLLLMNSVIAS